MMPAARRLTLARLISPTALVVAALPALAQNAPPKVTASPKLQTSPASFSVSLGGRGEYQFESDLDGDRGSVSIARAAANLGLGFAVGDRSRLNVTWDSEFSWYDWKDASKFSKSAKDPWDDTIQHTIGVQLVVPEGEQWAWFVGGGAQASYEREADFGDSLTYGGQGGVRYKFNDAFALSLGIAVRSRLEDNALILPIIGIDWDITDKLTLSTNRGAGLDLRYKASDAIALFLEATFNSREFRLRDDGAAKDGVGIDRSVPVAAGVVWTIAPSVSLTAKGGLVAWSKYKLEDQNGVKISETDADPAGFVSFGIDFRF